MKTNLLELLLIYLAICRTVWAQTNSEPTTQLPGNSEPLTSTTIQTPKTGDNRTEYETTTAIEGNDSVSIHTTADIGDTSLKSSTDSSSEVTNSSDIVNSVTNASESGNMSPTVVNPVVSEERQSPDNVNTTLTSVPYASDTDIANSSSLEVTPQLMAKSGKQLNFSEIDASPESQPATPTIAHSVSDTNESTTTSVSKETELPVTSTSNGITTTQHSTSQSNVSDSSASVDSNIGLSEGVTTLKNLISTWLNTNTSTESVPQTTDATQTAGGTTKIDSLSGEQKTPTETSVNYAETDTNSERLYISNETNHTLGAQSDRTPDPTLNYQSLNNSTDSVIPSVIYANASEINNNTEPEASKQSDTTTQSLIPDRVQSSTQETLVLNETEAETPTKTFAPSTTVPSVIPQRGSSYGREMHRETTHTQSPSSTIQTSTESPRSEQINRTESQPIQTSTESKPENSSEPSQTSPTFQEIKTTLLQTILQNSSMKPMRTTPEPEVVTSESTKQFESSTSVVTESPVGVLVANDSEPPIDSQTTYKLPLTGHSLKPTHLTKPLTTSIPHEMNISLIRVVLPNIKYISSISKEDLVNIVTVTFIVKSIDIFRWISVYDPVFRNHTCNLIDPDRNWCSIDRFVYLSPSPLITNNHLILNFFIDDSNENSNDFSNYHFFPGPQIVDALKNSTNALESMISMKVSSLQTNLGTMVVKPLETSPERFARLDLLLFVFIVVMFICTVLLCLAIICSYAKRKSVDMNQIQLSNAGRRHTTTNGGFDLNPASNILRDENQTNEDKLNHNVINLEGWVAPMDQIDYDKNPKYDNLQDTKL